MENNLLFFYFMLMGLGAFAACARLSMCVLKLPHAPRGLPLLLGFGLFPIIVSWLGFIGVFRIPFLPAASGILFALYGTVVGVRGAIALRKADTNAWRDIAPPVLLVSFLILATLIAKQCYLDGGINNVDDGRALAMTSGFAANYLKPAFPLDPSIPISYSYYLYETSAFFYAAVEGEGWPATAMLAVNIYVIIFFYVAFWHALRPRTCPMPAWAVCAGMVFVSFFGLSSIVFPGKALFDHHIEWWNYGVQVTQLASYFNWVYHYLMGAGFILAGLFCLAMLCDTRALGWLAAAILFFAMAPGYAALTGTWALPVIAVAALACLRCMPRPLALWRKGHVMLFIAVLCAAGVLLPQLFCFVFRPRFFAINDVPVWWFTRASIFPLQWQDFKSNLETAFVSFGPVLMIGIVLLPVIFVVGIVRRRMAWITCGALGLVGLLGLSYTSSSLPDWFWRGGNLYVTISSALAVAWGFWMAARYVPPLALFAVAAAGIAPGFINFTAEQHLRADVCGPPFVMASALHDRSDLHDVLVPGDEEIDALTVLQAGRLPLLKEGLIAHYRNSPEFLRDTIGWTQPAVACSRTPFGDSTPSGAYVRVDKDEVMTRVACDEPKVLMPPDGDAFEHAVLATLDYFSRLRQLAATFARTL